MPEVITPYQGGTIVMSEDAQHAAQEAQKFAAAFPTYGAGRGGVANAMSPVSKQRLEEFDAQMRSNPPRPATVVNILPWPLFFPATNVFLRGIQVPACPPTKALEWKHIRGYRRDWKYDEDGEQVFMPITPIQLAAEFVREFSQKQNFGGGVLIYEGESHPEKAGMVETYDVKGKMVTSDRGGFELDQEENRIPVLYKDPVKANFQELLKAARKQRNDVFFSRVQYADREYRKLLANKNDTGFRLLDTHFLMAEVLHAEGLLPTMPDWKLSSRMEMGLSDNNCKQCGSPLRSEGYACPACGNIVNVLEALRDGREVPEGKLDLLSDEELQEAQEIIERRDAAKARRLQGPKGTKGKKADV